MTQVLKKYSQENQMIKYYSRIDDFKDKLKFYYVWSVENNISIGEDLEIDYFLENNTWNVSFFLNLPQFKSQESKSLINKKIYFSAFKYKIKDDFKVIIHEMIIKKDYSIGATVKLSRYFTKIGRFLKCLYPNIESLLELDFNKVEIEWNSWLAENYFITDKKRIFKQLYSYYYELIIQPEEWEKDVWTIDKIIDKNHIEYNRNSSMSKKIQFDNIENVYFRNILKKYIKQRLLSNNHFAWGTALVYSVAISRLLNEIYGKNPTWIDLTKLERNNIEEYLIFLNTYANSPKNKIKNKCDWILNNVIFAQKFLEDIQVMEYPEAPIKDVRKLIYQTDKPSINYKSQYQRIKYIPDEVLEQLITHINELPDKVKIVVWIMFKTGLRISDTLNLRQDCLIKLNGKYWIEADIQKTGIMGHRIPIDDDLAQVVAGMINKVRNEVNRIINPWDLLFPSECIIRETKSITSEYVSKSLNKIAKKYNIKDNQGNIFHFNNHKFRHTYAVKLLNCGTDIITIQELMAHASPEMTLRYARLLDDTKRIAFDNAVKSGIFAFDDKDNLREQKSEGLNVDILNMLWTNHKLNAIETPYGTCMQRIKGKCEYAKHPPCLTCNNGSPCKDLCVGAVDWDIKKYEILLESTRSMIKFSEEYDRKDLKGENEELLKLYTNIIDKISSGNLIYGRLDRLKENN
jgi:integrase